MQMPKRTMPAAAKSTSSYTVENIDETIAKMRASQAKPFPATQAKKFFISSGVD
jgi:hypothetical protein